MNKKLRLEYQKSCNRAVKVVHASLKPVFRDDYVIWLENKVLELEERIETKYNHIMLVDSFSEYGNKGGGK